MKRIGYPAYMILSIIGVQTRPKKSKKKGGVPIEFCDISEVRCHKRAEMISMFIHDNVNTTIPYIFCAPFGV